MHRRSWNLAIYHPLISLRLSTLLSSTSGSNSRRTVISFPLCDHAMVFSRLTRQRWILWSYSACARILASSDNSTHE
ncbi:hypothetical protein EDD85DRAFT_498812 [Armillaria nabsnona]|nr:hypothetical protein EDD85DRAFT_498812 [Armillaria nabsnona]